MRISTDNSEFGVLIGRAGSHDHRFFRFQLIVAGEVIGDQQPGILGSAMHRLEQVPLVADPRLAVPEADPDRVLVTAYADPALHDEVLFCHAASLDGWQIVSYQHDQRVVWVARSDGECTNPTLVATVPLADYQEVVGEISTYWRSREAR